MFVSVIRTIIMFLLLMAAMRVMGKRQLGELEPSELVVAVLISELASNPLQDPGIPLLYGLIPVITLVCCELVISGVVVRSLRFRAFLCGKPSMLIDSGRILQTEMKKNRITIDELCEELRKQNVTDITTVRQAVLETNGTLSILPYEYESPLTPKQAGIRTGKGGYPVVIINNGRILGENLKLLGLDRAWLRAELGKHGRKAADEVYLLSVGPEHEIYFLPMEGTP